MKNLGSLSVTLFLCSATLPVALVGCNGGSDTDPDAKYEEVITDRPDETGAIEDAFAPVIKALCDWHFDCCTEGQRALSIGAAAEDSETCQSRFLEQAKNGAYFGSAYDPSGTASWIGQYFTYLGYDLDLGRVSVDEDALSDCADALASRECQAAPQPQTGCEPASPQDLSACGIKNILRGKQKLGQPCSGYGGVECEGDLVCRVQGTEGVCVPGVEQGSPCLNDYECQDEHFCHQGSGTCEPEGKEGDPCSFFDPDRPEVGTEKDACGPGLLCDPRSNECAPANCTYGSQCDNDSECPEDLFCVQSRCQAKSKLNQGCYQDVHCAEGRCDSYFGYCVPFAVNGEFCDYDDDCKSKYCFNQVCTKALAVGAECSAGNECGQGYCNYEVAPAVCAARKEAGDDCTSNEECSANDESACLDSKCTPLPQDDGDFCTDNFHCRSGNCSEDGECLAAGAEGTPCVVDTYDACGRGLYCQNEEGQAGGECVVQKGPGDECENSAQCPNGNCEFVMGKYRCGTTSSLGEAMCDGN